MYVIPVVSSCDLKGRPLILSYFLLHALCIFSFASLCAMCLYVHRAPSGRGTHHGESETILLSRHTSCCLATICLQRCYTAVSKTRRSHVTTSYYVQYVARKVLSKPVSHLRFLISSAQLRESEPTLHILLVLD